jgi:hypothetical protein
MHIREISRAWLAKRRVLEQSYQSQVIQVPVRFPFLIMRAKSRNLETRDGRRLIQQHVQRSMQEPNPRPIDPYYMREEFLSLRHDERELLRFLDKYGLWENEEPMEVNEYWDFQEFLRATLLSGKGIRGQLLSRSAFGKLPGPLHKSLTIDFEYNKGGLQFVTRTIGCLDAIIASMQIDVIRDTKYKKCARHDCPIVFVVNSQHKRKYHNESCKHVEVMRRSRERRRQRMSRVKQKR